MEPHRFDAFARSIAGGLPRRRLLRRAGGGLASFAAAPFVGRRGARAQTPSGDDRGTPPTGRTVALA